MEYWWQTFGEHSLERHIFRWEDINLLKPTGHVMHQQFNIQQL